MKIVLSKYRGLLLFLFCCSLTIAGEAQEEKQGMKEDTLHVETSDSAVVSMLASADSIRFPSMRKEAFKPDPKKAVLYALIPGMGQIYNRKYWKLPLVYGGFMGCTYAITWNNKNYQDYRSGYIDLMNDYSEYLNHPDYMEGKDESYWKQRGWYSFIPGNSTPEEYLKNSNNQSNLKRGKDYYRRYRDLSIIITVGLYAIWMIDAYVDAQLFDFDISPDLSFHFEPAMTQKTAFSSRTYGFNCSLKF